MSTLLQIPVSAKTPSLIQIKGLSYTVESIDPGQFGTVAYRLTKHAADGAVYDVIRTYEGFVECDCPSYESTHRGNGYGMCKHGAALVQLGRLAAPHPVNILDPTRSERQAFKAPLAPLPMDPDPFDDLPTVGPTSVLPTVHGAGLDQSERFRLNGAFNRARVAYARDCPDADAIELDRVAKLAAADELRRLLRDRPAATMAPAVADPFPSDRLDPDDCPSDPNLWPAWTDERWELGPEGDQVDEEPAAVVDHGPQFEPTLEDRRWWCQHAPSATRGPARRRVPCPHSDRDMRRIGAVG